MGALKPDFPTKARECLVASGGVNQQEVFTHLDEPDLVPPDCYAVVRVEFVRFETFTPPWLAADVPVFAGEGVA